MKKLPNALYLDQETGRVSSKPIDNAIVYLRSDIPVYNGFRQPRAVVGIRKDGEEREWPSVSACQKDLLTTSVQACIKAKCMCKGWALSYKDDFEQQ